jgi:polyphosphate kinase
MHRNLDRRVEALVRLTRPEHVAELSEMFDLAMADTTASWWLGADGAWTRHARGEDGAPLLDLQTETARRVSARRRGSMR